MNPRQFLRAELTCAAVLGLFACSKGQPELSIGHSRAREASLASAVNFRAPSEAGQRVALATAVSGKTLYAFGGQSRGDWATETVDAYDPRTGRWRTMPPMPTARAFPAAAESGGRIFVAGGMNHDAGFLSTFECFDPKTSRWERLPDMPTPRNRLAAVPWKNRIYFIGGMTLGAKDRPINCTTVEIYDPATQKWSRGADMPTPRHGHALAVWKDRFFVFGGYGVQNEMSGPLTIVEEYDPAADAWHSRKSARVARGFFGAATVGDQIYLIGGRMFEAPTEVYDPEHDLWSGAAPIPSLRNRFGIGVIDDKIYLVGGEDGNGTPGLPLQVYDPIADRWES